MALISTELNYYSLSLVGGLTFAMVSGSYANDMLEHIPAHDRPSHLAWYTIVLNTAVLIGSLVGPAVSDVMGLSAALLLLPPCASWQGWWYSNGDEEIFDF